MKPSQEAERPGQADRVNGGFLPQAITNWIRAHWIGSSSMAYIGLCFLALQPKEILDAFEQGKASTQKAAVVMAAGLPLFLLAAWLYERRRARKPIRDVRVISTCVFILLAAGILVWAAFAGINKIRINVEAIAAFEIGRDYDRRPDISAEILRFAELQYVRATEIDPKFALAFAHLARLHTRMYFLGYDATDERLEKAREALGHARELNRKLPQISLAEGYYYYWGDVDYAKADRAFQKAQRGGLRSDPEVFAGMGYAQRRRGRWSEALKNLRKAAELDPDNADRSAEVGHTYVALRCYPEAERAYRRARVLAPHVHSTRIDLAETRLRATGRIDSIRQVAAELPLNMDPDGEHLVFKVKAAIYAGDSLRALRALQLTDRSEFARQEFIYTNSMLRGLIRTYTENRHGARAPLDSARTELLAKLQSDRDDLRLHASLSQIYATLGGRDSAIAYGERAIRLLRDTRGNDALDTPAYQQNLAAVYAWVGEPEKALDLLAPLVRVASGVSPHELHVDPTWLPLRNEARFADLATTAQRCLVQTE